MCSNHVGGWWETKNHTGVAYWCHIHCCSYHSLLFLPYHVTYVIRTKPLPNCTVEINSTLSCNKDEWELSYGDRLHFTYLSVVSNRDFLVYPRTLPAAGEQSMEKGKLCKGQFCWYIPDCIQDLVWRLFLFSNLWILIISCAIKSWVLSRDINVQNGQTSRPTLKQKHALVFLTSCQESIIIMGSCFCTKTAAMMNVCIVYSSKHART